MATTHVNPALQGLQRTRQMLSTIGPVVVAFLAGQHHSLHMLLLTFGVGTAGMSFLTMYPDIRRVMLAASVVVAAWLAYRASRPGRARAERVTQGVSVVTTLALVAWSVSEFGL